MRRALLALAIPLVLGLPTVGASVGDVELSLGDTFRFNRTTLALGHLDPGEAELTDLHAVGVRHLDVPQGTLYVCPSQGGQRDEVPPIPSLQSYCRDEESYDDPVLEVGQRTWLVFAGNLTLVEPPNASMTAMVPHPDNQTLQLAGATSGALTARVDRPWAFRPQLPASQVHVQGEDDERSYNGTGWIYYLEASGTLRLDARGVHARVPTPAEIRLTPAGSQSMREAIDGNVLLDLQSAALGPNQREPVANVTRLVGDGTRLVPLVDGALLGHLNGTIGPRGLAPEQPARVALTSLTGTVEEGNLTGRAEVRFVSTSSGFAAGLEEPAGVPWMASLVLWILAGVSLALGPPAPVRTIDARTVAAGAFAIGLVLWDGIFASLVGSSALAASTDATGLGVTLALGAFEAISFTVAWLALAYPARLAAERWLVDEASSYTSPVLTAGIVVYAWLQPGSIVALGRLIAQV